jgi:hypothetical protein
VSRGKASREVLGKIGNEPGAEGVAEHHHARGSEGLGIRLAVWVVDGIGARITDGVLHGPAGTLRFQGALRRRYSSPAMTSMAAISPKSPESSREEGRRRMEKSDSGVGLQLGCVLAIRIMTSR